MLRFILRSKRILYLLALLALLGGFGHVMAQASGNSSKQTQVVLDGQVLIVADSSSVVAYDAGSTVTVKSSPDRFGEFLDGKFARDEFCWVAGPRAKEKGYHYDPNKIKPLQGWAPCDQQSSSTIVPSTGNGGGSNNVDNSGQTASGSQDCTSAHKNNQPAKGQPWNVGTGIGQLLVNVYNPFSSDPTEYKLNLPPGTYHFPAGSGGDFTEFSSANCQDAVNAAYANDTYAPGNLSYMQGLTEVASSGNGGQSGSEQSSGGNQPQQNCTPKITEDTNSMDGDWPVPSGAAVYIEFWTDRITPKPPLRKVWLEAGGVNVPGAGKAYIYDDPACHDFAWQEFTNKDMPEASFDQIWAEANAAGTVTPPSNGTATPPSTEAATEVVTQPATEVATEAPTQTAVQPTIQPQSTEIVTEAPTQAPTDPPATQVATKQNTVKGNSNPSKIVPAASPRG